MLIIVLNRSCKIIADILIPYSRSPKKLSFGSLRERETLMEHEPTGKCFYSFNFQVPPNLN